MPVRLGHEAGVLQAFNGSDEEVIGVDSGKVRLLPGEEGFDRLLSRPGVVTVAPDMTDVAEVMPAAGQRDGRIMNRRGDEDVVRYGVTFDQISRD